MLIGAFVANLRKIDTLFKQTTECFSTISGSAAGAQVIAQSCRDLFELKGEMYLLYQRQLEIYGKVNSYIQSVSSNGAVPDDLGKLISLLDEKLQVVKNQCDIVRKQTRVASQIYDRISAK